MDTSSKTFWRAIHSDNTVESSNHSETYHPYKEVRRAQLQKLVFYKKDFDGEEKILKEYERPHGPLWNIRWRLRTVIDQNGSAIKDRFWIIDDEQKIVEVRGNEEPRIFSTYEEADRKPVTYTPLDKL